MPIVTMRWGQDAEPAVVYASLVELLKAEAGMDSVDALTAAQDLKSGKSVEVYFDLGEDEAARVFSDSLVGWGFDTKIQSDKEIQRIETIERAKGWIGPVVVFAVILIGAAVQGPWYAVIFLVVALAGAASFFFIRSRNRNR